MECIFFPKKRGREWLIRTHASGKLFFLIISNQHVPLFNIFSRGLIMSIHVEGPQSSHLNFKYTSGPKVNSLP